MSNIDSYVKYRKNQELLEARRIRQEEDRKQKAYNENIRIDGLGKTLRESSESYFKFRRDSKDMLVAKALNKVFENAIPLNESTLGYYGLDLVDSYVKENSGSILLNKFKRTSGILSELALVIENAYDDVMNNVTETDAKTHIVDSKAMDRYDDILDDINLDTVSSTIKGRVQDSMDDFFDNTAREKATQEEILEKAKEKALQQNTEEKADFVMREATAKLNNRMSSRSKSILEVMVEKSSADVIKEGAESHMNNGALDMNTIFESSVIMYTFMETLNTLKLEKVNQEYVNNILNTL